MPSFFSKNADNEVAHRLAAKERELEAARRISEALFRCQSLDARVSQALQTAMDVVNAEAGCVLLADRESARLVFYHAIGDFAPEKGTAFPWDQGIAGSVFHSGAPVLVGDVKKDSRHFGNIDAMTGYTTRDMIALPLKRWEGEPVGVLEIMNKRDGRFDDDDIAILEIIAAFTALSVQEASLVEEAKLGEVVRILDDLGQDVKNLLMPVTCAALLLQSEMDAYFGSKSSGGLEQGEGIRKLGNELLVIVRDNSQRVQERVRQLIACIRGLRTPLTVEPCQIANLVNKVLDTVEFHASERNVTLKTEGLEELPTLLIDERRLFNAFYNLLDHAIAELPKGGVVVIRGLADTEGGAIQLTVGDTAGAMPGGVFRGLSEGGITTRTVSAAYLRARVISEAIRAHGGEITVEEKSGHATEVKLRLPLYPAGARVH